VLTFFAEDAGTHTLLYANADLSKASCNREVIAFADHWKNLTGHEPALLIFDSKLTTHPGATKAFAALPASAWASMTLGRAGNKTRHGLRGLHRC
jgi:hypothetical protein